MPKEKEPGKHPPLPPPVKKDVPHREATPKTYPYTEPRIKPPRPWPRKD